MSEFAPGDVVEIATEGGLAYAQVTHDHPAYPYVVRVLAGRHGERPADPATLAQGPTAFTALILLATALAPLGTQVERVATAPIPEADRAFPTFRMAIRDKTGQPHYWWFWDGEGLSYSADPPSEADAMPMREVMPGDVFMEKLGALKPAE